MCLNESTCSETCLLYYIDILGLTKHPDYQGILISIHISVHACSIDYAAGALILKYPHVFTASTV